MTKFKNSTRNNPCQICGNTKGGCSISDDGNLQLCKHSHEDSVPGWKYLKDSSNGLWGVYIQSKEDWTDLDKREWELKLKQRELEAEKEELSRKQNCLSIEHLDRWIRKLSKHLGLKTKHKEDLFNRGLTEEQIKNGLFFSVDKGFNPVPIGIPETFPGIKNGQLVSGVDGYACVAFDRFKRAIGFQLRDENREAENKYRWARGDYSSHLKTGELPMTVIKQPNCQDKRFYLSEGLLKPLVASYRHGKNFIGAAGFYFPKNQLLETLNDTETREVVICPDGGVVKNDQLLQQYQSLFKFLGDNGFTVKIAWWNQVEKHNKDIDEINNFKIISIQEFLKPVKGDRQKAKGFKPQIENLDVELQNIYDKKLSFYKEKRALQGLYSQFEVGITYIELEKAYIAFKANKDSIEEILENTELLNDYLACKKKKLNLHEILPKELADIIEAKAKSNNSKSDRYLLNTLVMAATCIGSRLRLQTNKCFDIRDARWSHAIFHVIDVSPTSNGKSEAFKAIFQPLLDRQQNLAEQKEKLETQLRAIADNWSEMSRQERKDAVNDPNVNPRLFEEENIKDKQWILTKGSIESIFKTIANQDNKQGICLFIDEFSRVYSFDQYKAKGGDSQEQLIESWNGPLVGYDLRVDSKQTRYFKGQILNLLGGMQPGIICKFLETKHDYTGRLSRILFTISDYPDRYIEDELQVSCYGVLNNLVDGLLVLPEASISMNDSAFELFRRFEKSTKDLGYKLGRSQENNALSSYLLKSAQQASRIALVLHAIECVYNPDKNKEILTEETMIAAIKVMEYQIAQFKILQCLNKDNEGVEGLTIKIIEKAKQNGDRISTRQVIQTYRRHKIEGNQLNTEMVLSIFEIICTSLNARIEDKELIILGDDPPQTPDKNFSTVTQEIDEQSSDQLHNDPVIRDLLQIDTVEKAIAVIEKYGIAIINIALDPIDDETEIGQKILNVLPVMEEAIETFTSKQSTY